MSTLQKGQTHSNNLSAVTDKWCMFHHFVGLARKGLRPGQTPVMKSSAKIVKTAKSHKQFSLKVPS